ncbi:MAG: hypothetical protein V3V09_02235 [Arenicellales bacterium]
MSSVPVVSTAVLLHLFNTQHWPDFSDALCNIKKPFDLLINLVEGTHTAETLAQQATLIRQNFPDALIITSENRGMDVGGMLRLFDIALQKDYQVLLYAHSKSNDQWRKSMLNTLTQNSSKCIQLLTQNSKSNHTRIGMIGHHTYPFDYYNTGPFIALMSKLDITLNTQWERYFKRFPNARSLPLSQRIAHALDQSKLDASIANLRPELDLDYAQYYLGNLLQTKQRMTAERLMQFRADQVIQPMPYFPGNFFWISMPLVRLLATHINFEAEYLSLSFELKSDTLTQSRAHAWERALPVFSAKNSYQILALTP